ncbi:MAG: hypothetical protein NZ959_07275 [Armatimonadetes bacterium]|nr:hypothetical protein [Armatimonadota bacterium]MDW8122300.1 hypothetical protein [Armatimonadota bacterium]
MTERFFWSALTVFLLSLTGLSLEIALTRIFAVVLRYHFAFLALAIALLGLGFGGYLGLWLRRRLSEEKMILYCLVAFPFTILLSLFLLLYWILPVSPNQFLLAGAVSLLPFLFVGGGLSLLLSRWAHWAGRLYAWDLAGAALAAGVVIVGLNLLGALNFTIALSGLAFLAAAFVTAFKWKLVLFPAALLTVAFAAGNDRYQWWDLPPVRGADPQFNKPMLAELADPAQKSRIVFSVWNAFGRTDVVASDLTPGLLHAFTDGEVPATLIELKGGRLSEGLFLMESLMGIPYALLTFPLEGNRRRPLGRVLSLGAGGGADVVAALIAGAQAVDAVEVNPGMWQVARRFRHFTGDIFHRPGVRFILAEGRSFVRTSPQRYDLIVMALTQTATMGKTGLALVESYIHTLEGCRDYWRALTDQGMVALITQEPFLALRWWLTCLKVVVSETGKDESQATRHIAWWSAGQEEQKVSPYRHLVILSRQPFGERWEHLLRTVTQRWGAMPVAVPGVGFQDPVAAIAEGDLSSDQVVQDVLWKVGVWTAPVTDDAPFFADLSPRIPSFLWQFLMAGLGVVLVFAVVAGLQMRSEGVPVSAVWFPTLYAAALGFGYLMIEVAVLQRTLLLLPSPTHSLALVVASMLAGSALGSRLSQRITEGQLTKWASASCLVVCGLGISLALFIGHFSSFLQVQSLLVRLLGLVLMSFLLGLPMGVPFPTALRLSPTKWGVPVPYLWGVNGVTSVLGSMTTVLIGRTLGYSKAFLFGGACYLLAGILLASWQQLTGGGDGDGD